MEDDDDDDEEEDTRMILCMCIGNDFVLFVFCLKMSAKEKRDIPLRVVILKFGVAVAISLGGMILYTFIKIRRNKPPKSKSSLRSPGNCSLVNSRQEKDGLKDDDRSLQDSSLPISSPTSASDLSSNGRYSVDRDSFLLPEFNELVKECNMVVTADDISPRTNAESLVPNVEAPKYRCVEHNEYDREIKNLLRKVETLQERERDLEIQLFEYYGLQEQETAVMELQNRLRLNNMESKIYNLKIDSLQSDNRRLEAQVADYAKVVTVLEAAKDKIKVLRKKLRTESEQNREQILNLQGRVRKLQEQEKKAVENEIDLDVLRRKRKELEEELEDMKNSNHDLELEKSELAQKLEYLQMLATSALDNEEVQELHKESWRLRHENEDLKKELEQLKADRSTDTEELVYLRWINACLRYELRNYLPDPGKTLARDLSRTLSPKSEDRAKKLILEYANKENLGDKRIHITDLDSDRCSSSQSYVTDSPDESSGNNLGVIKEKSNNLSRQKVFDKLKRLLKGKDHHRNIEGPSSRLERAVSMDEIDNISVSYKSGITDDGFRKTSRTSSGSSRLSLDFQRSVSRGQKSSTGGSSNCSGRNSVDGALSIFRRIDSITEDENDRDLKPFQDAQILARNELVKHAEALKKSRMRFSFRRRSSSFDSL